MKRLMLLGLLTLANGCTTGQLAYLTPQGETRIGCEIEYSWAPGIDQYAVEYMLSYCAMRAEQQGNEVLDKSLLTIDRTLAEPPAGKNWSHQLAKELYDQGQLSDKEYGYLLAALDHGHIKTVSQTSNREPSQ